MPPSSTSCAERLADASPLVRAMAVWALGRLASAAAFREAEASWRPGEADEAVSREWEEAGRSLKLPLSAPGGGEAG